MLVCGMDPRNVMAELTGRATGYSKGKGGSMHMFAKDKRFYGGHGIVGAQVPLGTGIAFAHKYREDGGLCATYMGDGAVNQGQVYESFNMAALWKLPVIYVIENNRYGMGTSQARASAGRRLCERGSAYGIPGEQVDGMDVTAVHEKAKDGGDHVRGGNGPFILEAMTYRYRGHSMSDPAKYRKKEELQEYARAARPDRAVRARILGCGPGGCRCAQGNGQGSPRHRQRGGPLRQETPEPIPRSCWTDILIEADVATV
jgi:pyruvate dehydrogenase E1 component alpha subunit